MKLKHSQYSVSFTGTDVRKIHDVIAMMKELGAYERSAATAATELEAILRRHHRGEKSSTPEIETANA